MRRIAFLLLGLCLTVNTIGCKKEATTPTSTDPAAPTGDADKDGTNNATDDKPADSTEK